MLTSSLEDIFIFGCPKNCELTVSFAHFSCRQSPRISRSPTSEPRDIIIGKPCPETMSNDPNPLTADGGIDSAIRTNFEASTVSGHNQVSVEAFHPRCGVTRLALPSSPDQAQFGKHLHRDMNFPAASCPDSAGGVCPWLESSCCKQGRTRS